MMIILPPNLLARLIWPEVMREVSQDYSSLSVSDLFNSTKPESPEINRSAAEAWIEAENVYLIRTKIIEWFKLMEDNMANGRRPDPFSKRKISVERAEKFCDALDSDFQIEVEQRGAWLREGVDAPPGFAERLTPAAKVAFMQEVRAIRKSPAKLKREAKLRLAKGELLPPDPWFDQFKAKGYCSRSCPSPKFCDVPNVHPLYTPTPVYISC